MNYKRITTIVDKEWAEVFRNKMVIFTVSLLPVVFTVLPLVMVSMISSSGQISGGNTEIPPAFMHNTCQNLPTLECLQIFLINQFLLMFMMMPLIIPVAIAAYSIVGEKTTRSLEPLLATPITTAELLTGKSLASVLPAIVITWLCFGIFLLILPVVGATQALMNYILGPVWAIAILIIGPLMAVASVNMAVIVSSRVNDPRVAEQMAGVLIVPILGVLFGQLAGVVILDLKLMMITIIGLILLDIALIYAGSRLFQREIILTRWK
jgi:ABC-2 type transport system permease protein